MRHDLNRENAKSPAKSEHWGFFELGISCEIHITGTHFFYWYSFQVKDDFGLNLRMQFCA